MRNEKNKMLVQITQLNKIMIIELFRLLSSNDRIGIETHYSSYVAFALALLARLKSNFTPVELLTLVLNMNLPLSTFRNQTARQLGLFLLTQSYFNDSHFREHLISNWTKGYEERNLINRITVFYKVVQSGTDCSHDVRYLIRRRIVSGNDD